MTGELPLLAPRECFMSNLIAAANARDVRIDDLRVDIHGTLAAAPPRFESIALEVRGRIADETTSDKLIQIAERGCIVHKTLSGSIRVEVEHMGSAALPPRPRPGAIPRVSQGPGQGDSLQPELLGRGIREAADQVREA